MAADPRTNDIGLEYTSAPLNESTSLDCIFHLPNQNNVFFSWACFCIYIYVIAFAPAGLLPLPSHWCLPGEILPLRSYSPLYKKRKQIYILQTIYTLYCQSCLLAPVGATDLLPVRCGFSVTDTHTDQEKVRIIVFGYIKTPMRKFTHVHFQAHNRVLFNAFVCMSDDTILNKYWEW